MKKIILLYSINFLIIFCQDNIIKKNNENTLIEG